MSFEEVIDADNRKFNTGNKYVYKGKEYYSLVELCKILGIPESTMRKRLAKKMSIEEAIEKALSFDRSPQDHLGNKFKNIEEMCKYWGVNKDTYKGRLKRGYSLEKALTKI